MASSARAAADSEPVSGSVKLARTAAGVLVVVGLAFAVDLVGERAIQTLATSDSAGGPATVRVAEARELLEQLPVAGPASGEGYDRDRLFGSSWAHVGECDVRDQVLARDLSAEEYPPGSDCRVVGGLLIDPYTGEAIAYEPGAGRIEVDHVVSAPDTQRRA